MKYYVKKCGHQELGSISDGKTQRGRYLFTSKNEEVLNMFPPLSSTELNDSAIIPIIPLYSGKKIYCNFVYHNSKVACGQPNGRDEYRIYLNSDIEENKQLFQPNDIVIIRQSELDNDGEKQTVYLLDLLQDHNAALYNELNAAIETSEIRGEYALRYSEIPAFEKKASRIDDSANGVILIDRTVTKFVEKNVESIAGLFNSASFRDFVMVGYGSLCAVTKTVIRHECYTNLEAAHIKPRSHGGLYVPSNGIALCRDMHWAFDKGFFTLNAEYEIIVHPRTTSEYLHLFEGQKILLPQDPFFRPAIDNIDYHSRNIYGLFLTSGRL